MVDLTDAELDVMESLEQRRAGKSSWKRLSAADPEWSLRLIAEVRRWRELTRHEYGGVPFMRTCAYCGLPKREHATVTAPGAASAPKEVGDE